MRVLHKDFVTGVDQQGRLQVIVGNEVVHAHLACMCDVEAVAGLSVGVDTEVAQEGVIVLCVVRDDV
ncbi:MAG: hypothetical protein LBM08_06040, partial [Dysgonamonadaceae bacterium]|nr:hypothetical protein [Dysgonamonadaceae bacterium]